MREFQRNFGIPPDGTCGPATLKALTRLSPMVKGGAPNALRAQEHIREAGPHLGGKVVVIDVGRGHNLPDEYAATSDSILHDLAQRVEGRLVATGVQAFLTTPRWAPTPGEEADRAAFANRTGADLFLSLALDTSGNPDACGVSTYFFGDADHETWSSAGERFAGLVQREIVARSDLVDLRWHPKTWDLLRRTRMPAIRLDVGYLTNARRRRAAARPRLPRRAGRGRRGRGAALLPQPGGRRAHRRAPGQRDPGQLPGRLSSARDTTRRHHIWCRRFRLAPRYRGSAGPGSLLAQGGPGATGNPVRIRDCPAAVSGNDRRQQHCVEPGMGSDGQ